MNISEAIDILITESPFLEEALADKLINVSSLARSLKPGVERLTHKEVAESAVIMAINRRPPAHSMRMSKGIRAFIDKLGDIIVRSRLSDHTFANSISLGTCQRQLMEEISAITDVFCTFSQGVYETTIVSSSVLDETISDIFRQEKCLAYKAGQSSITIRLPEINTEVSGVYYFILKQLAWAGINVREIISTSNEVTIVVSDEDIQRAFIILTGLKKKV
jgi:hypothetical protein